MGLGYNKDTLKHLVYKKPVPVEWDDEWWPTQKALAVFVRCSTGRVNACLKLNHKLRGKYVTLARYDF